MKKVLLIIGLLLSVILVSSYNYPTRNDVKARAYFRKTMEIMYDSNKRPHKIVIYSEGGTGIAAIDLDENTYK